VRSIEDYAFNDCTGLTTIILPNKLTNIGTGAFYGCSDLSTITIPNTVKSISHYAFAYCNSLQSLTIPSSVSSIGSGVTAFCYNLESVIVDSGNSVYDSREECNAVIETLSNTLIFGCNNTTFPNTLSCIGNSSLCGTTLTSVTIPNNVRIIGNYAFSYCLGLTNVSIPDSLISIGAYAFANCSSLSSVNIPKSLTSIGEDAFYYCNNLTSVIIPNKITNIKSQTFCGCSSLTSLTIPQSVINIGDFALCSCSQLKDLYCYVEAVPTIGNDVFLDSPITTATLHVPAASLELYQNAEQWGNFGNIVAIDDAVDITTLDYAIYCEDQEVVGTKQFVLPIRLKNQNAIASWQADLVLPEGFSVATDSFGDPLISVSGVRTTTSQHSVMAEAVASGALRILYSSDKNYEITGTDGEVATITINIADDAAEGDYTIELVNIVMAEKDATRHVVEKTNSTITVKYFIMGDTNNDGEIDALDLVALVNYIFDRGAATNIRDAIDFDNNGKIDVADYVALVNLIMSQPEEAPARGDESLTGYLTMDPWSLCAGEQITATMSLEGTNADFTCLQFDMQLPAGIRIVDAESLSMKHGLTYDTMANGSTRFLLASTSNKPVATEDIIRLTLEADATMPAGVYSLSTDNTLFATAHSGALAPEPMSVQFTVNNPSGISTLTHDAVPAKAHNLSGQAIDWNNGQMPSGVYLIDGKKVVVK